MRRVLLVLLFLTLIALPALSLLGPAPVHAQGATCYNLANSDAHVRHGTNIDGYTWAAGSYTITGSETSPFNYGGGYSPGQVLDLVDVYWNFPSGITISTWSVWDYVTYHPSVGYFLIRIEGYTGEDATGTGTQFVSDIWNWPWEVSTSPRTNSGTLGVAQTYHSVRVWWDYPSSSSDHAVYSAGNIVFCDSTVATSTPSPTVSPTPTTTPIPPPPGACTSNWTTTYDFRADTFGWRFNGGSGFWDTSGYHSMPSSSGGQFVNRVSISRDIAAGNIGYISLDVNYISGTGGSPDLRAITVKDTHGSTLISDASPPVTGHKTLTWSGTAAADTYTIEATASGNVASLMAADGDATINSVTFGGAGLDPDGQCHALNPNPDSSNWAFPVASGDQVGTSPLQSLASDFTSGSPESPFTYLEQDIAAGSYDHGKAATLLLAAGEGKYVHSATDGTVSSVVSLAATDPCVTFDISILGGVTGIPSYTCIVNIGGSIRALEYHTASVVTIDTGTADLTYIVNDVRVVSGQSVTKGCILGLTLPFFVLKPSVGAGSVTGVWEKSPDGYTIVQGRSSSLPFDVIPEFIEQPQDLSCGGAGGGAGSTGGCTLLRNSSFSPPNADGWYGTSLTSPNGATQGLWLKADTRQNLALIPGEAYTIEVIAHLLSPANPGLPYDFTITVGGGTAISVTVSDISPQTTEIASTTYPPDAANGFQISVAPTDNTRQNVSVDYVCINDVVTDPPMVSECILVNPYFDGGQGWTASDVTFPPGMAEFADGGSISQDVVLSPKPGGPQTYNITIEARRKGAAVTGHSVSIDWDIASQSGTFGPYSDQLGWHIGNDTFNISAKSSYTLTLTNASTPAGDPAQIQSVCITTVEGTTPPGYQAPPPTLATSCRVCSYQPVGDITVDLPEVIGWLFCAISQIWYCQARQILMGIWQQVVNILTFIGFARLWMAYTADGFIKWMLADWQVFIRWLNGTFQNLLSSLIPTGNPSGGGGPNFFDALIALINGLGGIVNHLIDAVLALAKALIGAVLAVIGFIINFLMFLVSQILNFLRLLIEIITNAVNAPASLPAGMPICDTSADMIPESCVGIFMLDHTVFAPSSPFAFIIPLVEGLIGFGAIWWAINKFRHAFGAVED